MRLKRLKKKPQTNMTKTRILTTMKVLAVDLATTWPTSQLKLIRDL